ncbi:UBC-like protein [Cryphonectria parasitica EP155]|uniref:UBC-like protein n=1 Tax=Cryphonectria parasitica (strain ATCC 38755 / EP155) TaxID=660469 RepID=A0A9P5CJH3_CRYP1|nr:UBC-like protein [Cryphonectria parasitica EP155]KAF3760157.1 UBC-like protein [Cryphonectria parasitica EP155]
MPTAKFNSKSPTIRRILREAQELSSAPSPDYTATPLETDLFEWHFTLRGPPGSPYAEGLYHGRIALPPTYPLRPPSFRFLTPSGRFEANREICLSISGHHEETWQPAWGVRTALVALRSFMETDPKGQLGGLDTSDAVRRRLAAESRAWRCTGCGARTNEEIIRECEEAAAAAESAEGAAGGASSSSGGGRKEVEVPAELKMGFRDEMEKKAAAAAAAAAATGASASGSGEDSESAELAEGFVQTAPRAGVDVSAGAARPGQTVPQPTRTVPLPDAARNTGLQQQRQALHDDAQLWMTDRVIAALAICLVAMLLKVILKWVWAE